ncbi:D-alanyl-D-alanine carboxypeptidase [Melghiribacillus thermohalophilus]|uniref:D-alanyl-D-alanine carboxypeptidase n=1 Tax=Melghiribacillus thermohalophilus TaxID=1324956 RepID=A0A4R3NBX0_9BACI|nr:D-alanyl-D-alanine carboxypeptidase family protein [Melghiribacillus thermohalophilus]TCT24589.1 D-alanyl-D-alanine carboxypeptidase [Melghiribacillus thermohalophilus]
MKNVKLISILILLFNLWITNSVFAHPDTSIPEVSSKAAIVMDSVTGEILYEKNSRTQLYPASLTKIATAIYAIEHGNLDDVVTVSESVEKVEGTKVYLVEGEQVTLQKLIQGLLINSGNDAGVVIAEHLNGSVEQFSEALNDYLTNQIGVKHTHFENPHGLFNANHVTTAEDLAIITRYAIQNDTFRDIFGTKELEWDGESWDTTLYTHHKLMRENPYEGITGGKTGFINESGHTLATTAERNHLRLIVITLGNDIQQEAYQDHINLLDYGFDHFETSTIPAGTSFEKNNKEFSVEENLYYTHRKEDQITHHVTEDGILQVMNQEDSVLARFTLEEADHGDGQASSDDEQKTNGMFSGYFFLISLSMFTSILVISRFIRRRKAKNDPSIFR